MGKLAERPKSERGQTGARKLLRLKSERRKLDARLATLDAQIARLAPLRPAPEAAQLERWFDQLTDGLDHLPPLPSDFSRADLYDDHD